jgi:dynein heavy chain 2
MILFTERCQEAIGRNNLPNFLKDVNQQLDGYTNANASIMGGGEEERVLELKLKALIFDIIHNVEVIEQLIDAKTVNPAEWMWQKQLRWVAVTQQQNAV